MKLIGVCIWYDESPAWLAAMATSMAPHIHHLVAVDGAYGLYPEAAKWSRPDQHEALLYVCQAAGIGLTLHTPPDIWVDNEVEKRAFSMRLAQQTAEPDVDWLWIMDSDQVVLSCPPDLHRRLEDTDLNVAETTFLENHPQAMNPTATPHYFNWGAEGSEFHVRNFFRALPDLEQGHNHFTVTGGGETLWGNASTSPLATALDLKDLRIDHRTNLRAKHRHDSQYVYYKRRDDYGVERGTCECGQPATQIATHEWENLGAEDRWDLAASWKEVCPDCKPKWDAKADQAIRELTGGDKCLADMQIVKGKVPRFEPNKEAQAA
jgi:hypothetical protein